MYDRYRRLKKINDTYGHDIGDKVIIEAVSTISSALPKAAVLGRLGGEEFGIICPQICRDEVIALFEDIKNRVASLRIETPSGEMSFTISTGIAKKSAAAKNIDELLKEADMALYEAKGSGKNRVSFRNSRD